MTTLTKQAGGPIWVMPSDLDSAQGLINLIRAAANALGREIQHPADHSDLAAAQQLLALLGLVEPAKR